MVRYVTSMVDENKKIYKALFIFFSGRGIVKVIGPVIQLIKNADLINIWLNIFFDFQGWKPKPAHLPVDDNVCAGLVEFG